MMYPESSSLVKVRIGEIFVIKIVIIFLYNSQYMCFGCSKDPSRGDGSFEYPQHMFWLGK